jgi:hypothetical protein
MSDVYEQWNRLQDERGIPAQDREAVAIPDLIMAARKVPEDLRPHIERAWDLAMRDAMAYVEQLAGLLVFIRQEIRDDDTD